MSAENHTHSHGGSVPATEGRTIGWANHYDLVVKLLTFGKERGLREQTIHQAGITIGAVVLDVGCGTGSLTLLAKTQAGNQGKVYGIDAAPEMIEAANQKAAQQKSDVDFQTALIEALPFADGMFDVVLSSAMFHHLPGDLQRRGLTEILRVLKPGGRLLIVDLKRPTSFAQLLTPVALLHGSKINDVHELSPLMEKVGYAAIQTGNMRWKSMGFIQGQRSSQ
ncbi:MAG: class I SAM-dependent methyltransferase [Chloroflexota bacterium]